MSPLSARESAPPGDATMSSGAAAERRMTGLDAETAALCRLAAIIAVGTEPELRRGMSDVVAADVSPEWVEEVVLQSYLFAGFPRALNAAREWRRASGRPAPATDAGTSYAAAEEWREQGEETCAVVYGAFYERLRHNIRELHPALDTWMIVDGYGKVLSRPALDLRRRELCIVAVCAAAEQDRQLHSHLHGARNAGATPDEIDGALAAADAYLDADARQRVRLLWARVRGK
ncbi:MAG TPA: carboxymuconolactone decarboxylase family protein [Gemmatimonadaceae bacterium]|nr:carboxymuconolactone decarboxylase family protein [Gemmatimonadaceae bacterium]